MALLLVKHAFPYVLQRMGEKSWQVTGTSDDNKEETVLFKFPEEVPKTDSAVLHIKWTADLKKDPIGLYRTTYRDGKGKRHTTISTHFEPTFARRCFPCFDEPKSKVQSCCVCAVVSDFFFPGKFVFFFFCFFFPRVLVCVSASA
jgi:hypothetical protein